MRAGYGQVEVQIQGRITTVQAVTAHEAALAPQTPIVVNAIEPGNVLVVSPRF
jgi:regulator of RNase E activity RraA